MYIQYFADHRSSLETLQPLILSPTSGARPEFLSSFVIQEMETMLKSLRYMCELCVVISHLPLSVPQPS